MRKKANLHEVLLMSKSSLPLFQCIDLHPDMVTGHLAFIDCAWNGSRVGFGYFTWQLMSRRSTSDIIRVLSALLSFLRFKRDAARLAWVC